MVTLAAKCLIAVKISVAPGVQQMDYFDVKQMEFATYRCIVHYPKSPCLVNFTKIGYHEYRATCGKGETK